MVLVDSVTDPYTSAEIAGVLDEADVVGMLSVWATN